MQSGCNQDAIRMQSGCNQDAIGMQSGCNQDAIKSVSQEHVMCKAFIPSCTSSDCRSRQYPAGQARSRADSAAYSPIGSAGSSRHICPGRATAWRSSCCWCEAGAAACVTASDVACRPTGLPALTDPNSSLNCFRQLAQLFQSRHPEAQAARPSLTKTQTRSRSRVTRDLS